MKLKIAPNDSFTPAQRARIQLEYEGADVTPELLIEISAFAPVAISARDCDSEWLAIDHPHSW